MIYTFSLRKFLLDIYPKASPDKIRAFKEATIQRLTNLSLPEPLSKEYILYTTSSAYEINVILDREDSTEENKEILVTEDTSDLPRQVLKLYLESLLEILEAAIHAKEEKYDTYTREELKTTLEDCYSYGRYMRRCETDFIWRQEDVPGGLNDSLCRNEDDIRALEFQTEWWDFSESTS